MTITVKDKHQLFAFTVKDVRTDSTDYDQFFDMLNNHKCIIECKYPEYDSKGKLHYHGVMQIPKSVRRTKLVIKGLSIRLDEVYNMEGWLNYIKKDQKKPVTKMFKKVQMIVSQLVEEESNISDEEPYNDEPFKMPTKSLFRAR